MELGDGAGEAAGAAGDADADADAGAPAAPAAPEDGKSIRSEKGVCVCVYIYIYIYIYVICMYTGVYIYIYIYTHTYIFEGAVDALGQRRVAGAAAPGQMEPQAERLGLIHFTELPGDTQMVQGLGKWLPRLDPQCASRYARCIDNCEMYKTTESLNHLRYHAKPWQTALQSACELVCWI